MYGTAGRIARKSHSPIAKPRFHLQGRIVFSPSPPILGSQCWQIPQRATGDVGNRLLGKRLGCSPLSRAKEHGFRKCGEDDPVLGDLHLAWSNSQLEASLVRATMLTAETRFLPVRHGIRRLA